MSVDYKFENVDDYFLVNVGSEVNRALTDAEYRRKNIEIFKLYKKSLGKVGRKGAVVFADNLVLQIDYLLQLNEDNKE